MRKGKVIRPPKGKGRSRVWDEIQKVLAEHDAKVTDLRVNGSGHYRLEIECQGNRLVASMPFSSSCYRGSKNTVAQIRRRLRQVTGG